MQHQFKLESVSEAVLRALNEHPATQYFSAMSFQLGCAIGELVGMGVDPAGLVNLCEELVQKAVDTRLTKLTTEPSDITKTDG